MSLKGTLKFVLKMQLLNYQVRGNTLFQLFATNAWPYHNIIHLNYFS